MQVAIIGAGAAGLVCAREMVREGHLVTLFEQSDRAGGIWVYDEETEDDPLGQTPSRRVHSSLYASLRTNLPRDLMAFTDYPLNSGEGGEDDWPAYPHHSRVLEYLDRFAQDFALLPLIRFRTRVTNLGPSGSGWWVTTDRWPPASFDAVAICNGHYSKPRLPALPGRHQFQGHLLHSHNYRQPDAFIGKRVALWGTGSSGNDISRELARVAKEVFWCGHAFTGWKQASENLWSGPNPRRFVGSSMLELSDGRLVRDLDALIFCTGYEYDLPFVSKDLLQIEDNRVHPLYLDLLAPRHPTLACLGLPSLVIPFPLMQMQSRWFARLLAGRFQLPESGQLLQWIADRERQMRETGRPGRHYHQLGNEQFAYMDALAAQCGAEPLPGWFRPLTEEVRHNRLADPDGYRDLPLRGGPTGKAGEARATEIHCRSRHQSATSQAPAGDKNR